MEKTFTLAQLLSIGATGLLTGLLLSKTLPRTHDKATRSADQKKGSKENKKESKKDLEGKHKGKGDEDEDEDEDDDDYSDEDSEDEGSGELADFDHHEEYKMVLVIRSDLNMGKGKAAAQCCHATLSNYKELLKNSPQTLKHWEYCGQAKVTLKVDNEDDMLLLQAQARSLGLAANSIRDAGRTQIAAGSRTVLAVGPGPVSVVNSVTGKLKLY